MKKPETNESSFRALLRYRAKVDDVIQNHQNSSQVAIYLSPQIQNEDFEYYSRFNPEDLLIVLINHGYFHCSLTKQ